MECYGSPNAKTPNIDRLAALGFRYTHCFSNAAVCAPTRSTWITGMCAISIGTQPMRSYNDIPLDKRTEAAQFFAKMAAAGFRSRECGHTGQGFSPISPYSGDVNIPEADYIYLGRLLATNVCRDFTFLHPETKDWWLEVDFGKNETYNSTVKPK